MTVERETNSFYEAINVVYPSGMKFQIIRRLGEHVVEDEEAIKRATEWATLHPDTV